MIDLHCHLLPGIDDGPALPTDSLALARAAEHNAIDMIVATPHVSWEYPNAAAGIARLAARLRELLAGAGVSVAVAAGAEIAMTRLGDIAPGELSRLTLAGSRSLLIEPSFVPVLSGFEGLVADLQRRGYRVVLAHPERCQGFHRDPPMLERLVRSGALVSMTAGSLDGRFGHPVRRFSFELLRNGLVHNVASDAHHHLQRPPSIAAELERAGLASWRDWLTRAVPEAIICDRELPPPPPPPPPIDVASPPPRLRLPRWLRPRG